MELKKSKIFNKETMQSVSAFCESQEIKDVDNFIYLCFKQGFDIKRYGFLGGTEQEKIVEVPIEIIKEIEKIVEVPVEKVVTKIEYIRDENSENELGEKITKLEKEMSKKDEELDELRYNLDIILDELRPNLSVFRNTLDELKKNLSENMVKDKSNLLQETIKKLKIELIDKQNEIKELQKVNQTNNKPVQPVKGNYLRGSNLI